MSQDAVVKELGQPALGGHMLAEMEGGIYSISLLMYRTNQEGDGTDTQLIIQFSESLGNDQIVRGWCVLVPSPSSRADSLEQTYLDWKDARAAWWRTGLHFGCHKVE
jgi:hypothetical protein